MNSAGAQTAGMTAILVSAVLWGTTGTVATFAPQVGPVAIGAAAMGIGGLAQALVALPQIRRSQAILKRHGALLLFAALCVAVYPLAFYASMRLAGVTIGTVISIGSAPLLAALIEMRVDAARLTRRWFAGSALGLSGMLLVVVAESWSHVASAAPAPLAGIALGLVAGLTYAAYSFAARRLMQGGVPSMAAMGAIFGAGGLVLMPVLLATGSPFLLSWSNASVGLYMALVPMFLGYLCFGYGLARVEASRATVITLFEPVVAAALAVAIVGERLPPLGWLGVLLVVACLACVSASAGGQAGTAPGSRPPG